MKILEIQDTHLKSQNPQRRIDKYSEAVLEKIKYLSAYAKEHEVDYIIHGGDVFDNYNISNILLDKLADIVEEYKIPWYIVPGNHDIIGQNWENSNSTSLAHIVRRSKYFHILETLEDDNAEIVAYPYYHGMIEPLKKHGLKRASDKFSIAVVHGMVTPKKINLPIEHVSIDELDTDYDIVFIAHNHEQHKMKISGGTMFYFTGCLGRRKINESDVKPSAYLLDTDKQTIDIVEVETPEIEKVFNMEEYEEMKEYEEDIEKFVTELQETEIQGQDIEEVVVNVCKEKEVKDFILTKIKKCKEE